MDPRKTNTPDASFQGINQAIEQENLASVILRTSRLGWLNCDRLFAQDRVTINFQIEEPHPEDLDIVMIFNQARVILSPSYYNQGCFVFTRVPFNAKVTLLATKKHDNQVFLAVKETILSSKPQSLPDFRVVSEMEYRNTVSMFH